MALQLLWEWAESTDVRARQAAGNRLEIGEQHDKCRQQSGTIWCTAVEWHPLSLVVHGMCIVYDRCPECVIQLECPYVGQTCNVPTLLVHVRMQLMWRYYLQPVRGAR
jgi:hypothetical protein